MSFTPDPERGKRVHELDRAHVFHSWSAQATLNPMLIAGGEEKLRGLRDELAKDPGGDWARVARLAEEEQGLAAKVDAWTDEWMKLSEAGDA